LLPFPKQEFQALLKTTADRSKQAAPSLKPDPLPFKSGMPHRLKTIAGCSKTSRYILPLAPLPKSSPFLIQKRHAFELLKPAAGHSNQAAPSLRPFLKDSHLVRAFCANQILSHPKQECRAFELLKTTADRSNYLMTKQAKIIAMTCTHAALKRHDFLDLGLKYDNLVMEESAQILEIETFIPMLLQRQDDNLARLKRVILIGDHHQVREPGVTIEVYVCSAIIRLTILAWHDFFSRA
jgi:hypothetical protein